MKDNQYKNKKEITTKNKTNNLSLIKCWCGSTNHEEFSDYYQKCMECNTLLLKEMPSSNIYEINDEGKGYYGKDYWTSYITSEYGLPSIYERSKTDLYERCSYWLEKILQYKLPKAKSVEIGCGNGSLVYLMKLAGFDSLGLELSKWLCDYAENEFRIKVNKGIFEEQVFEENSLDIVIMMDVLEHLITPRVTLTDINKKLNNKGILVIQTPKYEGHSFQELLDNNEPFFNQLKENEHVILFNEHSVTRLLNECGFNYVDFIKPLFDYDMFLIASKEKMVKNSEDKIKSALKCIDSGSLVLALINQFKYRQDILNKLEESEADRAARLKIIEKLSKQLEENEADRAARLKIIEKLSKQLEESEADRAARLKIIERLSKQLEESEADKTARLEIIERLSKQLKDHNSKENKSWKNKWWGKIKG